ncbi:MAG: hypothetical protein LUC44_05015 [Prevotellaceae bacterium]|nr:hypothetical protein [Prevotellaceae bacterium]
MIAKTTTQNIDIEEIQRRIDEGIRLAQKRLVRQAAHDDFTLVVRRNGKLMELKANEI